MRDENLIPLRKMDLEMGKPLRWSVYDAHGVLLLARGIILDSEHKVEVLFKKGLFRSSRRESTHERGPAEPSPGEEAQFHYRHDRGQEHPIARLPIGTVVSLQSNADDQGDRYACRYIGFMEGKSVLVSTPMSANRLVPCRDGQNFFVRFFNGRTALAFKANILKAHLVPFPYLHLSFPKDVTVMKVRASLRADVDIIATMAIGGANVAVRMVDLGVGGAHLHSYKPLGEKGESGEISFRIMVEEIEAYIVAMVAIRSLTVETSAGKPLFAYGVQFKSIEKEHKAMIMNLVYKSSVEGGS
jgi:c-di-GMP-binding flagellar brake protein YcgR